MQQAFEISRAYVIVYACAKFKIVHNEKVSFSHHYDLYLVVRPEHRVLVLLRYYSIMFQQFMLKRKKILQVLQLT